MGSLAELVELESRAVYMDPVAELRDAARRRLAAEAVEAQRRQVAAADEWAGIVQRTVPADDPAAGPRAIDLSPLTVAVLTGGAGS